MKFSSAEYDEYIKHIEAELKRMRPVCKAVAKWYRLYSDVSSDSLEGTFPREMVDVHRAFARAERAKRKK